MIELGADPHRILGAHAADGGGVVVRAYRPEATAVRVQPAGVEARFEDRSGLWEALLPKAKCATRTRFFRRSATSTSIS